jgi:hypothetical protein
MVAAGTANQEIGEMGFDGTVIDQPLDDAVDAGSFAGVAAIVVDREGVREHRLAGGDRGPRRNEDCP